jgi:hypothetical protein
MSTLDLSKFRQNFVKDKPEDIHEIAAMKFSPKIGVGVHEVVITGIHEKNGEKFKLGDRLGGSVGLSLILKNAKKEEQLMYMCIPLVVTFVEACRDTDKSNKFVFRKTYELLETIGIDPFLFRETVVATDGKSIEKLIGAQLVIVNTWREGKLHLEYDQVAKAHFFHKCDGTKFESGELSLPVVMDSSKKDDSKFAEFIAIARENAWDFSTQMETDIQFHASVSNDYINEELSKLLVVKKPVIVNKTVIPSFPIHTKKILAPLGVEEDVQI